MIFSDEINKAIALLAPLGYVITSSGSALYVLRDPLTKEPKYVGKANNPKGRLLRHMRNPASGKMRRWVEELKANGLKPAIEILEFCQGDRWKQRERHYIEHFRSLNPNLLNIRSGGDGPLDDVFTQEVRKAMSESAKAFFAVPSNLAAHKQRMREIHGSAEARAANSARQSTPEMRAIKSAKLRATLGTPEARAAASERQKIAKRTPEFRAKASAKTKLQWGNPEYRAKMIAGIRANAEKVKAKAK
jgi:hypothetical protein